MKTAMHIRQWVLLLAACLPFLSSAQNFSVDVKAMTIENLPGIQSYAWGQHDGKWLIMGGRVDGLHLRQPNQSFNQAGQNNSILVVDPMAKQFWTSSIQNLPTGIREQLQSTNMQFFQKGDYLYLTGGYGYSVTNADHITYPNIMAIDVPGLIQAVMQQQNINSFFRQKTDEAFAVCGGYMNELEGVLHLTGGHRFDGRYNPMGGPSYVQTYTERDRKFVITDDGVNWSITQYGDDADANAFHRRDYNVVPQIFPGEKHGLIAYSGVFQTGADLPFLDAVIIDSASHHLSSGFSQYYQQYHCAHVPLYSSTAQTSNTLFFGGIAQYFDSAGILVQDNAVPFVKTISRVSINANWELQEQNMGVEMPGYLGASAEFIPLPGLPIFGNDVIDYDQLHGDTILIGHIFGGISSTQKNIFFINNGTQSSANPTIYEVYLLKGIKTGVINLQSQNGLALQAYPNPSAGKLTLQFDAEETETTIRIRDVQGKEIYKGVFHSHPGMQEMELDCSFANGQQMLFVEVENGSRKGQMKLIINR